jgi:hypothetical protein
VIRDHEGSVVAAVSLIQILSTGLHFPLSIYVNPLVYFTAQPGGNATSTGCKISIDARCGELVVLCDEFPTSHVYIFLLCNSSFLL